MEEDDLRGIVFAVGLLPTNDGSEVRRERVRTMRAVWCVGATCLVWATGCVPVTTVYDYQIEQKALVPTNAAPRAVGPLAREGNSYLEGGLQIGVVGQVSGPEARLNGHEVPLVQGHVRAGFGVGEGVELGMSGRYTNSGGAASASVRPREPQPGWLHTGGLGAQFRAEMFGNEWFAAVLGLEGSLDVVPGIRTVYTNQTDIIELPGDDWVMRYPERQEEEYFADPAWSGGAQLSAQVFPLPGLSGELGARVSTQPKYFGARNTAEICGGTFFETCDGVNPDDVPRSTTEVQGTVFGGAMLELPDTRWSLGTRGWWTPWGPQSLSFAAPGGGELTVRLALD